jgi:hypothetical protein
MQITRRVASRPHQHVVSAMSDVPGAEVVEVNLPRDPAPSPPSRTVQSQVHQNLRHDHSVPSYPLRVAVLPHARLARSGGVISQDGALVFESLWDLPHYERDFAGRGRLASPTPLRGVGASLIGLWDSNYYHWIFNCLPRLKVLQESGVEFDYLIVPENLRPFQKATLSLLGYEGDALVPFTGEHVAVERLVWPAPLAPIDEPSSFLLDWVRGALRREAQDPFRRLYVSRGGTRRVANEDEVWRHLEPLGYEFMLPEEHSFEEQVEIFGQARVAVAPHGSNLVNSIFSDRMSVLELFSAEHVNHSVYSLLCAAGIDHWSLICEPVRRRFAHKRFSDVIVDVPQVDETLKLIEAEIAAEQPG